MRAPARLLALLGAAGALRPEKVRQAEGVPAIPHFDAFLERFGRSYPVGSAEYALRRGHYEERAAAARLQNAMPDRLWAAGVSHLWDRTHDEFSQMHGYRHSNPTSRRASRASSLVEVVSGHDGEGSAKDVLKSATKHWALKALEPVNQGPCGSCWAVSAATVLQAHAELAGANRTFSAQHMVNCVPNLMECGGTGGCEGATVELAMSYAETTGMASNAEVPYSGKDGSCDHQLDAPVPNFRWETLPENQYQPLVNAIVNDGPVAVSVAADAWMIYMGGIFNGCGKDAVVNHAVVLVGIGSENDVGYWQIRNSWGAFWGEKGHIRVYRSEKEYCGTDYKPEDGLGCKGGPPTVPVCGMCGILFDSVVPHF